MWVEIVEMVEMYCMTRAKHEVVHTYISTISTTSTLRTLGREEACVEVGAS
ncbi:unnamed protein product [marine sediment metagenome]|uniref:Uncharacterized protein n=1 Tax=marine sediment metagenome TaxID=412755 RepID=X0SVB3_9ZZZZ